MTSDVRYALRGFRRSPGFAAIAVGSLALGIGANTAMFSLVNAVLLRSLPVREPDRLAVVTLSTPDRFGGINPLPRQVYGELRDKNSVFDGLAGVTYPPITLASDGSAERVSGLLVSANFFDTLGVEASIGRTFSAGDEHAPVCVIGYSLWQSRFAGDPRVIGRNIMVNANPFTVIGVTRREFVVVAQDFQMDIAIPINAPGMDFSSMPLQTFGRLKRGVSRAQAETSIDALYRRLAIPAPPWVAAKTRIALLPGHQGFSLLRRQYEKPVLLLMGVVGLVLLIACGNIANLLMARSSGRSKEIAVRLALGAGRARLIRQLLFESLLMTIAGAAAGVALAYWIDRALIGLAPSRYAGGLAIVNVNPDARVLLFTLGIAAATGILCGLAPAIRSTRPGLAPALKGEAGMRAPGRFSFANALVVLQVALSLVLVIGAGLFLRSLRNVRSVDPGLNPDHTIVLTIDSGSAGYSVEASQAFFERVTEAAKRVPGVASASYGILSPLSGDFFLIPFHVPGYVPQPGEASMIGTNWISPGYFKTLQIPVLAGRTFDDADGRSNKVAIVDEATAKHFFGHGDPMGKHIVMGNADCEIVGVVRSVNRGSLRQDPKPMVYLPFIMNHRGHMTLVVRAARETAPLTAALLREIRRIDPNLPPTNVSTMQAQIEGAIVLDRMLALLTAMFGGLGLALAAGGLYGVMAFAVAARTREIGIRMALGAAQSRVLGMILRESALLAIAGIALGIPLAMWASRAAAAFLYGLSPTDPWIYTGLALAVAALVIAFAGIPARRASRVDPMVALRYE